jgi:hypothetical protein
MLNSETLIYKTTKFESILKNLIEKSSQTCTAESIACSLICDAASCKACCDGVRDSAEDIQGTPSYFSIPVLPMTPGITSMMEDNKAEQCERQPEGRWWDEQEHYQRWSRWTRKQAVGAASERRQQHVGGNTETV